MKISREREFSDELGKLCSGDVFIHRDGDYYIRCLKSSNDDTIQCVNLETGCSIFLDPEYKVCHVNLTAYVDEVI
ncbi:MAG: hypothetical protein J6S67_07925 [Methanobrevibacter sp.]|nr:hypothetical protein [Methanobrevibacter sp.]